MKIKTKFTLWISLASLIAAILFSWFILSELKEELIEMLDQELTDVSNTIFTELNLKANSRPLLASLPDNYPLSRYWLKISDESENVLYSSRLAEQLTLPSQPETSNIKYLFKKKVNNLFNISSDDELKGFVTKRKIPYNQIWIPPGEEDDIENYGDKKIRFWICTFNRKINGKEITVHIAKPLLLFQIEYQEIVFSLFWGIIITVSVVLTMAYFITHRMLSPLVMINTMIRDIREKSLDQRIPRGKSKDELYELTNSLNAMFDRLEYSFKHQKDFVSSTAHELKSPLTVLMLGHEEMLATDPDTEIRRELEKQLGIMQRLNKLVRDLLSIARLKQEDTINREAIQPNRLINNILQQYEDVIKAKNIKVQTSITDKTIYADKDKFQRVIINLVDNGIKYNLDIDGWITINGKYNSSFFLLEFTNSGREIPANDIEYIFNQFYRVEKSRSQAYGGSGLGLTIVKRIVEMHSGTISAKSGNAETSFRLSLLSVPSGQE